MQAQTATAAKKLTSPLEVLDIPDIHDIEEDDIQTKTFNSAGNKPLKTKLSSAFTINVPVEMRDQLPFQPKDHLWIRDVGDGMIVVYKRR